MSPANAAKAIGVGDRIAREMSSTDASRYQRAHRSHGSQLLVTNLLPHL
jgi:hypothetical protein